MAIDISKLSSGMFLTTLDKVDPGSEVVYHVGKYAAGPHKKDALTAQQLGHCLLYQRRLDVGIFAYIARKPKAARASK